MTVKLGELRIVAGVEHPQGYVDSLVTQVDGASVHSEGRKTLYQCHVMPMTQQPRSRKTSDAASDDRDFLTLPHGSNVGGRLFR